MIFHTEYGSRDKAIDYQKKYLTFLDSILNSSSFLQVQSIYNEKKDNYRVNQISNLSITISKQRAIIITAVIAAVIFGMVIFFLVWRNKISKKANQALVDKYQLLIERHRLLEGADISGTHDPKAGANEKQQQLFEKIETAMRDSDLWCDEEFDLKKLAHMVGSTPVAVSDVLNNVIHKNFRTFVAEYRIREACSRMKSKEYDSYSIDGIGASVGFGSRHTFLRAFKKETGILPSVFRKLSR